MAALRQAVQLLREATAMADSQTRAELQQAWAADRAWTKKAGAAEDDDANDDDANGAQRAPSPEAHAAFFEEAGLRAYDAQRLARDLRRDVPDLASRPLRDVAAALAVLARAVPGVPPAELALRDSRILAVPSEVIVGCMVALVAAFPGRDAGQLILRCPRLVLQTAEALAESSASAAAGGAAASASSSSSTCSSEKAAASGAAAASALSARVRDAMQTLVRLHPSHDYNVVAASVCAEPSVLLRMARYRQARLLDELPLEVQTVFVEADRGIGWLHKHWKRVRKEEAAEAARRAADGGAAAAAGAAKGVPLSDWRSVVGGGLPPLESPQSTLELDGPGSSPFESPQSTKDGF
jgi:hypothetical protein